LKPACRERTAAAQKLAFVFYEDKPGCRSAAKLLTKDEAHQTAVTIAKVPDLLNR
jgi:hypothetical protein